MLVMHKTGSGGIQTHASEETGALDRSATLTINSKYKTIDILYLYFVTDPAMLSYTRAVTSPLCHLIIINVIPGTTF